MDGLKKLYYNYHSSQNEILEPPLLTFEKLLQNFWNKRNVRHFSVSLILTFYTVY